MTKKKLRASIHIFFSLSLLLIVHELSGQNKVQLRVGVFTPINSTKNELTLYNPSNASVYYSIQKKNLFFDKNLSFTALLEKQLFYNVSLSTGIYINDNISAGYELSFNTPIYNTSANRNKISGSAQASALRFPLHFLWQIYPIKGVIDSVMENKNVTNKIYTTKIDFCLGINFIDIVRNNPWITKNNYVDYRLTNTGDTVNIINSTRSYNQYGYTVNSGFRFRVLKKGKEQLALHVYYEYGLKSLMNVGAIIQVNNITYQDFLFSSGSRLFISISRPIKISTWLKKSKV